MSKEKSSNDLINIEIYFDEFRRPSFMTVVSSKCRPLYPLPQRGHRTEGPQDRGATGQRGHGATGQRGHGARSEEHTSELQSQR